MVSQPALPDVRLLAPIHWAVECSLLVPRGGNCLQRNSRDRPVRRVFMGIRRLLIESCGIALEHIELIAANETWPADLASRCPSSGIVTRRGNSTEKSGR
jgi:hypothetical protein